ncbi:hypothetical protein QFW80_13995 [Luteimonas sp. M1R5S18]|uniref:Uncharacterized protein n=1 Tax=Luteimonas rhizosphaericola TaxID=3042024 RepID=A0ABT6JNI5_9GAMM|nr:hypothetical protein [Luteimonas rhizosphaericola]MDH5831631.1 hypothetical protein [Luteimonas rhizosphaericola]
MRIAVNGRLCVHLCGLPRRAVTHGRMRGRAALRRRGVGGLAVAVRVVLRGGRCVRRVPGMGRMADGPAAISGPTMIGVAGLSVVSGMVDLRGVLRVPTLLRGGGERCEPEQEQGQCARMPAHAPSSTRTSRIIPASMW